MIKLAVVSIPAKYSIFILSIISYMTFSLLFLALKDRVPHKYIEVSVYHFCGFYLLILCLFLTGCSKIPPQDDGLVSSILANRIDSHVDLRYGCFQDEKVNDLIDLAITNELTADLAIQIALLNNPKVQAVFEEIGIARADLIEAGLLSNPSFALEVRYPHVNGLKTNIEYLITSSLLDIFLIPLRTRLASTEFEQTKLKVSNEILSLAFDVRETFYELLAEKKKIHFIQSSAELTGIISEISAKKIAIGNVNTLEFQLAKARFLEAELELSSAQAEFIRLREKLNRLLGLNEDICLIFPENLPEVNYFGFDLCALESIALQERLDLQVARFEIGRISQMLGLKGWWIFTNLNAGLVPDGDWPSGSRWHPTG